MTRVRRTVKSFVAFTAALLCVLRFTSPTLAAPDPGRLGSVYFSFTYQGQAVAGGNLKLFRFGQLVSFDNDGYIDYIYDWIDELKDCGLSLSEMGEESFAQRLSEIVDGRKLDVLTQQIDSSGKARFGFLETGLYVFYQTSAPAGFEKINPFTVSIPMVEDGEYIYDINASPKPRPLVPETTTEEPTTEDAPGDEPTTGETPTAPPAPEEPELPRTGQLKWPVPVVGSAGLIMIVTGVLINRPGRKENGYEN